VSVLLDRPLAALPEKRERIRKYWRTPKSVLRSLGQCNEREAEPYDKEQILEWLNAAAPMAASKLINQLAGPDESLALRAAITILEWSVGKPRPQVEGVSVPFGADCGRRIEIIITDPEAHGDIIESDAGPAESGADSDK